MDNELCMDIAGSHQFHIQNLIERDEDAQVVYASTAIWLSGRVKGLHADIEDLKSDRAKAIEAAYYEGRCDATCNGGRYWEISNTYASLHKGDK